MKGKLECRLSSFFVSKKDQKTIALRCLLRKKYRFALCGFVNKIKNLTFVAFFNLIISIVC